MRTANNVGWMLMGIGYGRWDWVEFALGLSLMFIVSAVVELRESP